MKELHGREEIKQALLTYLIRARRDGGVISIKFPDPSDRKYVQARLYDLIMELNYRDISIITPDREGEVWLTKKTNLSRGSRSISTGPTTNGSGSTSDGQTSSETPSDKSSKNNVERRRA